MPFLNTYIKSQAHSYSVTKKISGFVFSLGVFRTSAEAFDVLILKTDLTGNIIWEKRYNASAYFNLQFKDIVQFDNGDLLLQGYQGKTFILLKLNSTGNVIWSKTFQFAGEINSSSMLLLNTQSTLQPFVVNVTDYQEGVYGNRLLKLDSNGNVVTGKSLDYSYYSNDVNYAKNNLVLVNNQIIVYRWGSFSRFDDNLNLLDKFRLVQSAWVQYLDISGQELIMGGYDTFSNRGHFFLKVNYLNYTAKRLFLNKNDISYYAFNDNSVYAASAAGEFTAADLNLNVQWRKKVSLSIYNVTAKTQNVLFSGLESASQKQVVALLNTSIDSCKTLSEATPQLKPDVPAIDTKFTVTVTNFNIKSLNIQITEATVSSVKQEICTFEEEEVPTEITIGKESSLQSSNFYLQAAGSEGNDSSKGIHLRWALREELAEHLPKGNYASTTYNFNKSEDFVSVYRTKYIPYKVTLDFNNPPASVNEGSGQKNWIYSINQKIFHVHFRDIVKYNQVRASIDPMSAPLNFIATYGESLLEIETRTELSFKITPIFKVVSGSNSARVEVLSVAANKLTAPKAASIRKKFGLQELNDTELIAENIRSIRFMSTGGYVMSLAFEFYFDFISNTNKITGWNLLGKYALTKEDNLAFKRLEPKPDCLKNWLRYNEQAYVNPDNYKARWSDSALPPLERIVTAVERYIDLSDAYDNPKAIEVFPFDNQSDAAACNATNPDYDPYIPETTDEATGIPISYLDVLQLGAADYHNARMLGLGTLDLSELVFDGEYMYVAEYFTIGDLHDGLGAREVQHLYCSLPTSLTDARLPIPVDLLEPEPGLFFNNGYDDSDVDENEPVDPEQMDYDGVELTDDGYTPDGRTRYYTFYAAPVFDEDYNAPFYYVDHEFFAAESTYPVFAGLEYRKTGDSNWIKPELSYNPDFYNLDYSGIDPDRMNETVEIVIPENGKPLYSHAVRESGKLDYSSYGINWFSRASQSDQVYTVETILKTVNELLPPTTVMATLIQKESPLLLSTAGEQALFLANPDGDKTLVRLTFEYNHAQELIDYHQKINGEEINNYFENPDYKEPFAEEIQVFFRDHVPTSVYGKVKTVTPLSNPLLVEVTTEPYNVISQGINVNVPPTVPPTYNETYIPSIIAGTENNYIGSILLVNGVEYVIQTVDNSGTYPKFTVLAADASGAMLNLNSGGSTTPAFSIPEVGALFMAVENMQNESSWHIPANLGFTVNIDLDDVYREPEIIVENTDCSTETHVQKFRGVYQDAVITKELEKVDLNNNGTFDVTSGVEGDPNNNNFVLKHLGLYKITFSSFALPQHSQYHLVNNPHTNSVEWYNGIVRLHTLSDIGTTPRKEFKVIRAENIGTTSNLVLYIQDLTFPTDDADLNAYKGKVIPDGNTSVTQTVNYYPGYKVYLYKDNALGLNQNTVLPQGEEDIRYTIFGLRSKDYKNEFDYDNTVDFFSKMSIPALMFANAVVEPVQPEKPTGGMYATRPDYFGKASYTFNTKYGTPSSIHKPYAVQFNRASDVQFLSAIYDTTVYGYDNNEVPIFNTVQEVMNNIFMKGEEDFYVDRWNNLLGFNYTYPSNPADNGLFKEFEGRRLPMPDSAKFIDSINAFITAHNQFYNLTGSNAVPPLPANFNLNTVVIPVTGQNAALLVKDFVKDVLMGCFVPLTEIPVVYNYVNGSSYTPIPKKQVIRDRNGDLLKPTDTDFDMAPMMKRLDPAGSQYESQFTDFGLDGASNARYFYAVREINNQLVTSDYSAILGPISMVNTAPPVAPQILKVIPVLENRILDTMPAMQLQINSYPKAHHVVKASIYRTTDPAAALSIRTMDLVKVVDLEAEGIIDETQWILNDGFEDLPEVPFGDPLFYRMTVLRRIRYNDKELNPVVDYTPSEASKLVITNVVENYSPDSPVLDYFSEPLNAASELKSVILHWEKACYKAKYYVYKMNSQGNWVLIHELQSNDQDIYLQLADTDLQSGTLTVADSQSNTIYHHFKVVAENTAGMLSLQENILTIYIAENWQDIGGIPELRVGNTFIIR